jgi:hypothetical protein
MRRSSFALLALVALSACARGAAPSAARPSVQSATAVAPKEQARAFSAATVDAMLRAEWKRAGVAPSPRADDATYLRRVYVDIVGSVPAAEVTTRFLADTAPDKREKLVETLLASHEYAEHWMNYWDDVLMGRETKGNLVDRISFRYWLRGRFAANAPWDRMVTDLVAATGQNGLGGPKVKGPAMQVPMGSPLPPARASSAAEDDDDLASINGAVNWTLRFEQSPQDLGGNASRVFLGVQIQCAQCHDHKMESWKQEDFRRFSSAFFRSKVEPIDRGKVMGAVKRVDLVDAATPPPRFAKNADLGPVARAKATALDGTDLEKGADTRKALAAWMTSKDNRWFAKAFVNRMWGHFLGRGFTDPVDDVRESNPPMAPEVEGGIASDFVAHDFDIKHLVRTLCATEAYQLSSERGSSTTDPENKLWGRFHLVPLGPEELLNAIFRVTELEKTAQKAGIKNLDTLRSNIVRQYAFLFDTDEENDEPDYSGTVSQALALLNGALVAQGSRALPSSTAAEIANGPGTDTEKVDAMAMRVLARHATPDERDRWAVYITGADARAAEAAKAAKAGASPKTPARGGPLDRLANKRASASPRHAAYEDLLWALLNSSEFTFNH